MLLRTGVDMVDIGKLASMIEISADAFLESSWTAQERRYCGDRIDRLAARWAAKEATMKALGGGLGAISPLEVEVTAVEGQMPELALSGNAASRAAGLGIETWSLSLTHEDPLAIAFVVGLGGHEHG